jgi:hypothetical protein
LASCIAVLATVCVVLTAYVPVPPVPVQVVGIGLQPVVVPVVLLPVIVVPGWIPRPTSVSPTLMPPAGLTVPVTVSVPPVQGGVVGLQGAIDPVKDASLARTADTGTAVWIVVIVAVQGWTYSGE